MNDVDFLSLDNASGNAFDATQMAWIRAPAGGGPEIALHHHHQSSECTKRCPAAKA